MKEESLPGYQGRQPHASKGASEGIDACWAWTDRILERTMAGEWVARGVIYDESSPCSENHDRCEGTESLVDWLYRLQIPTGITADSFRDFTSRIESIIASPTVLGAQRRVESVLADFRPAMDSKSYMHCIDSCREAIRQGESYELTLTTTFTSRPPNCDPFALYLQLRSNNPAYYSTYIHFPCLDLSVLSSSPERFVRIDGKRQMESMPIKGTRSRVKPDQCVCQSGRGCEGRHPGSRDCVDEAKAVDRRIGEELQADLKERAENLMVSRYSSRMSRS